MSGFGGEMEAEVRGMAGRLYDFAWDQLFRPLQHRFRFRDSREISALVSYTGLPLAFTYMGEPLPSLEQYTKSRNGLQASRVGQNEPPLFPFRFKVESAFAPIW